ncbi:phage portal protein [Methylobacterium sp.]|uniref:phage portal protein n=1 Tax=Methylobacterium sp. TaxID=409 RepID=UPI0025E1848D|nr:phage portal protein [Methylobacterium sp.]MBY0256128.1 phage portal protein [Methylobacterium sp.]
MGFLSRLMGRERRAAPPQAVAASDPYLMQFLGFGRGTTGFASPEQALSSLGVASRCTTLIAESLAALPLVVYRRMDDGGREEARDHPLSSVLNVAANDRMPAFNLRELLVRDVLLGGNGYAKAAFDGRGRITALDYLPARMVGVEQLRTGRLRYRLSDPVRGTVILTEDETAHLRYASRDGIFGVSPLAWANGAVGLALAQSALATTQAERGFVPEVAFETDAAFNDDDVGNAAFVRIKRQLTDRLTSMRENVAPLLLEAGLKAKPLAQSGREAQFHEARMAGLEDIARIYGVPLSVVGLGNHASYGSLKEESQALVRDCLRPMAARIEAQLNLSLLSSEGRRQYRIEHDLSDLLRGDLQSRLEAYRTGIDASVLAPEECRIWEGLSSQPAPGHTIRVPLNAKHGAEAPQAPPGA